MIPNFSAALYAEALAAFPTLPEGIAHPPRQSTSIDFFPGGTGMCVRGAPFPVGGVMVLGHNYGSDLDYSENVENPETTWCRSKWATCRETWNALQRWNIDPAKCFFTNFYPGYVTTRGKDGKPFNLNAHPHVWNTAFVQKCREFFVRQLQVQRPRTVLVLGRHVPPLIAPLSAEFRAWSPWPGFAKLDAAGTSVVRGATVGEHTFNACVLLHPSFGRPNEKHRSFCGLQGKAAESAMVQAVLSEGVPAGAPSSQRR